MMTKQEVTDKLKAGVHKFYYMTSKGEIKRTIGTLSQDIIKPLVEYSKLVDISDKLVAYLGRDIEHNTTSKDLIDTIAEYDKFRTKQDKELKESDNITYYDLVANNFRVFNINRFQAFVN